AARYGHAMAFDSVRKRTVLFSGDADDETWEWDGTDWMQRVPAAAPPARMFSPMVFDVSRGVMVLFGGDMAGFAASDTWEYDGATWTQRTFAVTPAPRRAH